MEQKRKRFGFDRNKFDSILEPLLKNLSSIGVYYTYIAESRDGNVFKFGLSRNPAKRESGFRGGYRRYGFKMIYFLPGNIEYEILLAISSSGAETPLPTFMRQPRRREAYYMNKDDIDYIAARYGFLPIEEFIKYRPDEVSNDDSIIHSGTTDSRKNNGRKAGLKWKDMLGELEPGEHTVRFPDLKSIKSCKTTGYLMNSENIGRQYRFSVDKKALIAIIKVEEE